MDETITLAPRFGAKELERLSRLLERYKAAKTRTDKRIISSENWWKLRNTGEENSPLTGGEGFHAVSGWLHNVITSKHADAMDAYPEPVILPREQGDADEARRLQAVIPCILERNGFERTYSDVAWQKLKSGTGAYKVIWDKDALGGLGDIAVERVNLLNLFYEPGITDIQRSEAVFHTELVSRDALIAERPDLASRIKAPARVGAHFAYDDTVDTSDKVTVVECYYKKKSGIRSEELGIEVSPAATDLNSHPKGDTITPHSSLLTRFCTTFASWGTRCCTRPRTTPSFATAASTTTENTPSCSTHCSR